MSDGMSDAKAYGPGLSKHGAPLVSLEGRPEKWEHVVIRGEVFVNGEPGQRILVDIAAPPNGLFLVAVDPEGREISRTQVPTK